MDEKILHIYIFLSVVLAVFDLIFARICLKKEEKVGKLLGYTAIGGAAVDLTYLLSVLTKDYFTASVMSSAYFVSIDWLLLSSLEFINHYTNQKRTPFKHRAKRNAYIYAAFETVVFAVNPFWEIAITYAENGEPYASFSYVMKPLYMLHLVFTYTLVIYIMGALVLRTIRTPSKYRNQYLSIILGLVGIVGINAVFLYTPVGNDLPHLDYSILGYSIMFMLMYWSCFEYTRTDMLKGLSLTVFDNIGQGIVLFDFEGNLVMFNERAKQLLRSVKLKDKMPMERFLNQFHIPIRPENLDTAYSIQCYLAEGKGESAVRCDFRPLRDERNHLLGSLYVFTDAELETDLLTGFHMWKSYQKFASESKIQRKQAVAVFDINGLGVINSTYGVDEGDRRIRLLASAMRKCLPADTYYIRGQDAVLIAVCYDADENQMRRYAEKVQREFDGDIQFAVSMTEEHSCDCVAAIDDSMHALAVKKLLDNNSNHSQALTSLVRALQECDSDTEAHVQRTQKMGQELGMRIDLSDRELSDLRLLCLLHDIGKIGIPLDILNKPSKLTEEEWAIIRSHVEKGYQIARSSDKLSCIAEMILHHHERWDGKGYPAGLSRESIPLLSRIIAVVDTFDAMTNDRPYHKATPVDEALEEIRRCAGSQFDPFIAGEFIRMMQEKHGVELARAEADPVNRKGSSIDFQKAEDDAAAANVYTIQYARYLLDDEERIVEADDAFSRLTGYEKADWQDGKLTQFDLIPPNERVEYIAFVSSQLAKSSTVYLEHRLRRKDGKELFVLCYSEKIYDPSVKARRTKIIISDVSTSYSARMLSLAESDKSEKRLRYWEEIYRRDSMTGLLNHISFQNDVEQKMLSEYGRMLLLMLDVDYFKEYNDTFGHDAGDELLVELARSMKNSTGKTDMLCRMGGDEFAVAFPFEQDTSKEDMRERVLRVYNTVCEVVRTHQPGGSVSGGVAISTPEIQYFKSLYRAADQALYCAKRNGRSKLIYVDDIRSYPN